MEMSKLKETDEDEKYKNEAKRLTSQLNGMDESDSNALKRSIYEVFYRKDRFTNGYILGNKNMKEFANAILDEFEKDWKEFVEKYNAEKIKTDLRNNDSKDPLIPIYLQGSKMVKEYVSIFTYLPYKDNKKEMRRDLNEWKNKKDIKDIITNIKSTLEKEGRLEWHEPAEP